MRCPLVNIQLLREFSPKVTSCHVLQKNNKIKVYCSKICHWLIISKITTVSKKLGNTRRSLQTATQYNVLYTGPWATPLPSLSTFPIRSHYFKKTPLVLVGNSHLCQVPYLHKTCKTDKSPSSLPGVGTGTDEVDELQKKKKWLSRLVQINTQMLCIPDQYQIPKSNPNQPQTFHRSMHINVYIHKSIHIDHLTNPN